MRQSGRSKCSWEGRTTLAVCIVAPWFSHNFPEQRVLGQTKIHDKVPFDDRGPTSEQVPDANRGPYDAYY